MSRYVMFVWFLMFSSNSFKNTEMWIVSQNPSWHRIFHVSAKRAPRTGAARVGQTGPAGAKMRVQRPSIEFRWHEIEFQFGVWQLHQWNTGTTCTAIIILQNLPIDCQLHQWNTGTFCTVITSLQALPIIAAGSGNLCIIFGGSKLL